MDDLSELPSEEAADQVANESTNNENTAETSDAALSLGDLSDVDTEVDEPLGMLSPSLFAPLLQTGEEEEEPSVTPNKLELEAQSSSTDPFASLFDGLVITGQENEQSKVEEKEETEVADVVPEILLLPKEQEKMEATPTPTTTAAAARDGLDVDTLIGTVKSTEAPTGDVLHAEKEVKEEKEEAEEEIKDEQLGDAGLYLNEEEEEVVVVAETDSSGIVPSSFALDTESAEKDEDRIENQQEREQLIVEVEVPPPPSSLPPPPPLQQQQKRNKANYPDITGASLLELAEHAESRLAFGAADLISPPSVPAAFLESPFISSISEEWSRGGGVSGISIEREGYSEEGQAFRKQLLVARLVSQLESTSTEKKEKNKMGTVTERSISLTTSSTASSSPSSSFQSTNTSMGTNLAARAFISPQLEPLFKRGGGGGGSSGDGASPPPPATTPTHSIPSVVAKYLGIVAVGTSAGSVHVLMPKAGGRGAPHLHALQDRSTAGDAVTAIALGQHAGGLILVAGHTSGQLRLWETKPVSGSGSASGTGGGTAGSTGGVTWVLARTVNGVHASAVTACTVIDGGTTTWVLTADAHGRLMCHSVNRLLSITAQALAGFARQWAGGGAAAAAAAASTLVSLEAAGQDPGVVLSLSPLGSTSSTKSTTSPPGQSATTSQQQQQQSAAKTLYTTTEGSHFVLIVATRAVLLAAISSEGSLTILHIFFPPPIPEMQGEIAGCAAWRLEDSMDSGAQHTTHVVVAIAWGNSVSVYRCALTRASKSSPQPSPSKGAASGSGGGGGSPPRAAPAALAPPQFLSTFSSEHPVNGLGFIGPLGALVVALADGEVATEITIYHPSTFLNKEENVDQQSKNDDSVDGGIEKLKISDWMVVRQLGIPGAASLHSSLATSSGGGGGGSDQLLLLTSRGVRVIHLLTWHQRLSTLVGLQKLEVAMLAAVRLYLQATMPALTTPGSIAPLRRNSTITDSPDTAIGLDKVDSSPSGRSVCLWPADGAVASDAEEIARQLLTILHAFIDSKLHRLISQTREPPKKQELDVGLNRKAAFEEEAEQLADISVNTCLLLSRSEALFGEIAPKFLSSPFASAFLCQLEPRILADELPSLAPEVMQALVEHFAHSGQLERIERCVLKLDILSLDLNQLIPLCLRHGLYGALIHIFIGALQDYQTPATLLLIAAAAAAASDAASRQSNEEEAEKVMKQHQSAISSASSTMESIDTATPSHNKALLENSLALQLGYRLLVYLRGCLSGLQYPPGSGPAPPQQQQAVRLHAVTFLLHVNTAMLLDTWQLWASVAHLDNESESGGGYSGTQSLSAISSTLPSNLHDPSPVLRYLCQMDAPAVLGVLCDGLKGWDALESDLVDLSPELGPLISSAQKSSGSSTSVNAGGRTITQAAVDAVVQLLQEEESFARENQPALLKFVAEHLAAQRASADDAVLLRVLRFLAEHDEEEQEGKVTGSASPSAPAAVGGIKSSELSLAERESIFKDIVVHIHGNGTISNTNTAQKISQVRGEALDLARKAGFHQAEARIRHLERSFSQAFTCLVEDGARYPLAPFQYLRDICFDPGLTESDRNLVKSTALKLAPQLVRIDAAETAAVVAECFSQESHVAVLEALAPWPDDQFAFLQAAIEGSTRTTNGASNNLRNNGESARGIKFASQRPGSTLSNLSNSTRPMSPESTLDSFRGDPLFAPLLNNKNVSSLYVRLLCRFQPTDVLPFLQSHDTYNVDECLKHCTDHGAREAAAFLLERKGDVQAALKMYLEQVDVANSALILAVKKLGVDGIPSYYSAVTSTTSTGAQKTRGKGISTTTAAAAPPLTFLSSASPVSSPLPGPPAPLLKEFIAARDAMNSAVSMCVRFTQDRLTPINSPNEFVEDQSQSTKSTSAENAQGEEEGEEDYIDFHGDPIRAVWFEVLQRYVSTIRKVRAEEKENNIITNSVTGITTSTPPAPAAAPAALVEMSSRLNCLERIFTVFMEEVISQMAGHVPLHSIAAAVLHKYNKDSFGDFRATLSSLLGACNFELAILRCASRVTGTDTIALLKQGYTQCTMPKSVVETQQNQENIDSTQGSGTAGGTGGYNSTDSTNVSGSQISMNAALRSLESAQQRGHEAWVAAAAAAGPAASKLMEKAGFA